MTNQLHLLNEVAKLLKKRPHQVVYAITSGLVQEPQLRIGNRRIFQAADIQRLARHFALKGKKEEPCTTNI